MIAIDSSSLIAFLGGERGGDVDVVDEVFQLEQAVLPPVVLTEILSDPRLDRRVSDLIKNLPVLEITEGFWERAAAIRATVLEKKLHARLADALISQSCIDYRTPLITRDLDFRHFAKHAGLQLA